MVEDETLDGLQIDHSLVTAHGTHTLNDGLAHLQRMAGLGTLAAGVAHELSNPVSIITAAVNNLLSQVADDDLTTDQLLHYVEMVDHSAWRCARLIQTLRTYAHPETAQKTATDLNQLIQDALNLVTHQFRRQFHVTIEADLAPDVPPLFCDTNQVIQVLINLLLNARDALPSDGGVIQVASRFLRAETAVSFAVRDSGVGIAPEIMEQIFDPFFTTKPPGEGTGLGLAIAAAIVEQHHGRLEVANNPGGGATFTVVLPCRAGEDGADYGAGCVS
jgi:two-component system, NtrC family, sensor kinase